MNPLKLYNNTRFEAEKNLCFVNTALQLLYSDHEFRNFFTNKIFQNNVNSSFPICDEISAIFRTLGRFPASAAKLRTLVGLFSGVDEISDRQQKDITHFLRLLLQTLETELSSQPEQASGLIQRFWGKEKTIRRYLHT